MTSYRVFITKSSTAAYTIAHGYAVDMSKKQNDVVGVSCGSVDSQDKIPAMYYGKGYFYCAAEQENADESKAAYELIVC